MINDRIGDWRRTAPCIECWDLPKRVHLINRHSLLYSRATMNGIHEPLVLLRDEPPVSTRVSDHPCHQCRPLTSFVPSVVTRAPAMLLIWVVPYGIYVCRLPARSLVVLCGSRQGRGEIHRPHFPEALGRGFPDGGRSPSASCYLLRPFRSGERLVTRIPVPRPPFRRSRDRY